MPTSRIFSALILVFTALLNVWAFRWFSDRPPPDAFLRLMVLVLNGFLIISTATFLTGARDFAERARQLATYHPRKIAVFAGLFMALCCAMMVEFACRMYFRYGYAPTHSEQTFWEPSANVRDNLLGTALPPDTVISHAYVVNDSLIYRQRYRTDGFGRRITPASHTDQVDRSIIITGCSFAFGYGVGERQTLAFHLDSLTGFRGYNYGVSGHGTQQLLALLQSRDLRAEVPMAAPAMVHLFIDDHLKRLIGSRRLIKLWAAHFPYYTMEGGMPVRKGSFWNDRHALSWFYRTISQSAFIDLFDIDVPWYISSSHMELFGAVIREARNEFKEQFPDGRFLVVVAPNSELAPRVVRILQQENVEVLNLDELFDPEQKAYRIHWTEGHPNGLYYQKLAIAIAEQLD